MKIYLATDHAGFNHKEFLKAFLLQEGYQVVDCGATHYDAEDDFPDYIASAAEAVSRDPLDSKAVIFGGSGQGEAMLANQYKNVRAAVYYGGSHDILKLSREHNDANVLSFGARFVDESEVPVAVSLWLSTAPLKDAKYARRIKKAVDKVKQFNV